MSDLVLYGWAGAVVVALAVVSSLLTRRHPRGRHEPGPAWRERPLTAAEQAEVDALVEDLGDAANADREAAALVERAVGRQEGTVPIDPATHKAAGFGDERWCPVCEDDHNGPPCRPRVLAWHEQPASVDEPAPLYSADAFPTGPEIEGPTGAFPREWIEQMLREGEARNAGVL